VKLQKQYSEKLIPFQGKLIDLECPEHGISPFTWEKHGRRYRCRGCNSDAILRRKIRLKSKLIEERGGKCEHCGYDRYIGALHFHHIDPSTKLFNLAQMTSKSEKLVREEVAKCVLLCANCHAEHEDKLRAIGAAGAQLVYTE